MIMILAVPAHSQSTDEQYQAAIESADTYFEQGDYLNAKASYQVASQLKPDEQYPKDRLKESIGLLRVQMEQSALYNDKLIFADRLFNDQSYEKARKAYEEALKIMPSEAYPQQQIEKINTIMEEEAANEARYSALLAEGDVLFASEDYQAARAKYEEASRIYPARAEAQEKLQLSDQRLEEIAAQQSGYQKAISQAEMYHARKDYENELKAYEEAAALKPNEALPQIKIRELNDFLRQYESYNAFVSKADDLYINKQYEEAKLEYQKALEVLPDEPYPKEIISKINLALAEKTEKDRAAYEEALAKADALYNQENYESAMQAYSEALRYWPEGEHARERIGNITEIIALQKAKQEAYANAITLADKLFADEEYQSAREEYRKAADINPFEQYPKVRMDEIELILAEIQDKLDQYESIIVGADKLFNAGDYSEARIQYLRAQDILSDRTYPEGQIRMIDEILGFEKATREEYDAAIARGDAHFEQREWEDAKVDYVAANDLIPEKQYPKDKINEINGILAQLKAEQETYSLALKTADQLYAEKDYAAALQEYRKAADIFTNEAYPREKIDEINTLLEEQARLEELESNYAKAISEGDEFLAEEKFARAKAAYELALSYKAEEQYPSQKITEIDGILAENARLQGIEDTYNEKIAAAEKAHKEGNYDLAKEHYGQAQLIKPEESYPAEKIAEIDARIAEEARLAEQERQRILEENYAAFIKAADDYFNDESYAAAKTEYRKASELKSGEQYPQDKIIEIDAILAEKARLSGIEEAYSEAIAGADTFLAGQQYAEAKAAYEQASNIKPDEEYPKQKISEIDATLAEIARQQGIDDAYAAAIEKADNFFNTMSYSEAREAYLEAAGIKAAEEYPAQKIAEIDAILAEQARLAEMNEQYKIAIATADNHFKAQQYEEARTAYERASAINADEAYPGERIAEIDNIMANLEQQRLTDEGYANAIARGDNFLSNKEYEQAKAEFEQAITFKPAEQYPKDKITEIEGILAELARLQEIEDNYNAAISSADEYFNNKQYAEARAAYATALGAKPDNPFASGRIAEIDAILAEQNRLQQIEDNYNIAIASADAAFTSGNYPTALEKYRSALDIKPGEAHPQERINEINTLMEEQARQLALDQQYNKAISAADSLFGLKEFESAISAYYRALEVKPDEAGPQEKISEAEKLMEEIARQKALDDQYAAGITAADEYLARGAYMEALQAYKDAGALKPEEAYPKEKIAEINLQLEELEEERQKAYDAAIAKADSYYEVGNYRSAKSSYQTAVDIKPDESYARERLDEVTLLYQSELEELKADYRQFIADADNYFNEKIYDGAIENYRLAAAILPDEDYPGRMIAKITKIINDNAITDVNKLAQVIPDNTSRKFPFTPLPVNVRKANYILIKAKNVDDHDFKMLINFGRDNSKNGGVVLQVPQGQQTRDYIIRIGGLYRWFSEDNNWISVLPEGGDIEVALIRISKSD